MSNNDALQDYRVEMPAVGQVPIGFSATAAGTTTMVGTPAVCAHFDYDCADIWTGIFMLHLRDGLDRDHVREAVDGMAREFQRSNARNLFPATGCQTTLDDLAPHVQTVVDCLQVYVADDLGNAVHVILDAEPTTSWELNELILGACEHRVERDLALDAAAGD